MRKVQQPTRKNKNISIRKSRYENHSLVQRSRTNGSLHCLHRAMRIVRSSDKNARAYVKKE